MVFITSYYSKCLGKTSISISAPKNKGRSHQVKDDLEEIRKEMNKLVPLHDRTVNGVDTLVITYFPHMEIEHYMVSPSIQF
ncbi:hypothetical protein HPMBJEAJ_00112 [Aeromonas phage avDM6]|nr:hypothetical protein HPMBJEAJ_00112 [Aeromonas phage avDM6]